MFARAVLARRSQLSLSTLGAILISLAMAGQAFAQPWQAAPIPLAVVDVDSGDLVAPGGSTAIAAFTQWSGSGHLNLYTRRSANSGASWASALWIAEGWHPAIAGLGSKVDLVWTTVSGGVRYGRSTNGGASFGASIFMGSSAMPFGVPQAFPDVARGPNGLVAVVWASNHRVYARVSQNGGASFGATKTVAINTGSEPDHWEAAVAVGSGVIYVAYSIDSQLRVRRSLDGGSSWTSPAALNDDLADGYLAITAEGTHAYVAYDWFDSQALDAKGRYRRTLDSGASWSGVKVLAPRGLHPDVLLRNGVLRAAFLDGNDAVTYRKSTNGLNWGLPETVSPAGDWPVVGWIPGTTIVFYLRNVAGDDRAYARVRP